MLDDRETPTEEFDQLEPAPAAWREPETVGLFGGVLVVVVIIVWVVAAQDPHGHLADVVTSLFAFVFSALFFVVALYLVARLVRYLFTR